MWDQNRAHLTKLAWIIQYAPHKLWVQVIHAKYMHSAFVWDAKPKPSSSWFWKGISRVASLLKFGMGVLIGSGSSTNLWLDPWILSPQPHPPRPQLGLSTRNLEDTVNSLFVPFSLIWNSSLVRTLFEESDADWILNCSTPSGSLEDKMLWTPTPTGDFSVKSSCKLLPSPVTQVVLPLPLDWKKLWKVPMQNRLKLLL